MGRPRNPPTFDEVLLWFTRLDSDERNAVLVQLAERHELIGEIYRIRSVPDESNDSGEEQTEG